VIDTSPPNPPSPPPPNDAAGPGVPPVTIIFADSVMFPVAAMVIFVAHRPLVLFPGVAGVRVMALFTAIFPAAETVNKRCVGAALVDGAKTAVENVIFPAPFAPGLGVVVEMVTLFISNSATNAEAWIFAVVKPAVGVKVLFGAVPVKFPLEAAVVMVIFERLVWATPFRPDRRPIKIPKTGITLCKIALSLIKVFFISVYFFEDHNRK
jgi:hypothetical protein